MSFKFQFSEVDSEAGHSRIENQLWFQIALLWVCQKSIYTVSWLVSKLTLQRLLFIFLVIILSKKDKTNKGSGNNAYIVIDQASIHKTEDVKQFEDKRLICLLTILLYFLLWMM